MLKQQPGEWVYHLTIYIIITVTSLLLAALAENYCSPAAAWISISNAPKLSEIRKRKDLT